MSGNILAILPEILLLVLAVLVLALDLTLKTNRRSLGWFTGVGLLVIFAISVLVARPTLDSQSLWGGMVRFDWLGFTFKMLFLFAAAITCLFSIDVDRLGSRGEFYILLLSSTIGMCFMASAGDLVMLYLAIETTSIPLYVMAGFMTRDPKSTESGFKYLLFGALTSTIMLYGFSLLYGFSGQTNLEAIASAASSLPIVPLVGSLLLVLVGFGFKISAVPFHFWAPDVYEGAPTPVAGFLSTASKAAGFAVLVRVLISVFPSLGVAGTETPIWVTIISVLAVVTMTLGNTLALAQKNIKRLLAYSSIAHAGYTLIGVAAFSQVGDFSRLGLTSVVFYMLAYMITNLAAFGVVVVFWRITCSDDIASYAGLSRRSPGLALVMMVAFLSLAGMPPLGGFISKVFVFAAAVNAGLIWLAIVGVLNSIIGLYYYLTVLKVVYLYRNEEEESKPLPVTRPQAIALGVLTLGIILVGTLFGPWYNLMSTAAQALITMK